MPCNNRSKFTTKLHSLYTGFLALHITTNLLMPSQVRWRRDTYPTKFHSSASDSHIQDQNRRTKSTDSATTFSISALPAHERLILGLPKNWCILVIKIRLGRCAVRVCKLCETIACNLAQTHLTSQHHLLD